LETVFFAFLVVFLRTTAMGILLRFP
jgi:hypothetical protein